MRRYEAGFTLLEMIIVLVILGLLLSLTITRGPLRSARLDAEASAREIAGALRLARGRAIAGNQPVTLALAPGIYQVQGMPAHRLPADVSLAGDGAFRFAPDGSSSGGKIVVRKADIRFGITVDWLTGRVRVANAQ